jgi:hypothetical protein
MHRRRRTDPSGARCCWLCKGREVLIELLREVLLLLLLLSEDCPPVLREDSEGLHAELPGSTCGRRLGTGG